jgi:two-component system KDP operon response regulator KdpE
VVVLDLGLPDIDGLAVCKRIRQWSEVPIIILSASGSEDRKVAALNGGADDYVTKPFGMAELEARIRTASGTAGTDQADQGPSTLTVGLPRARPRPPRGRLDGRPVDLTPRSSPCCPSWPATPDGPVPTR